MGLPGAVASRDWGRTRGLRTLSEIEGAGVAGHIRSEAGRRTGSFSRTQHDWSRLLFVLHVTGPVRLKGPSAGLGLASLCPCRVLPYAEWRSGLAATNRGAG